MTERRYFVVEVTHETSASSQEHSAHLSFFAQEEEAVCNFENNLIAARSTLHNLWDEMIIGGSVTVRVMLYELPIPMWVAEDYEKAFILDAMPERQARVSQAVGAAETVVLRREDRGSGSLFPVRDVT